MKTLRTIIKFILLAYFLLTIVTFFGGLIVYYVLGYHPSSVKWLVTLVRILLIYSAIVGVPAILVAAVYLVRDFIEEFKNEK